MHYWVFRAQTNDDVLTAANGALHELASTGKVKNPDTGICASLFGFVNPDHLYLSDSACTTRKILNY